MAVVRYKPLVDVPLDLLFFLLLFVATWSLHRTGFLNSFLLACGGVCAVIVAVSFLSRELGAFVSRTLLSKPPFSDPLGSSAVGTDKFSTQFWQFTVHASMAAMAFWVAKDERWLWEPESCIPWNKIDGTAHKPQLVWLYIAQLSIWIVTCFSHRFLDKRAKDYHVMYLHHVTTIGVVVFSFSMDYLTYGLYVFFIHDFSDVFLDLAKLANYLKLTGRAGFYLTEILFGTLLLIWICCRLVLFPNFLFRAIFSPIVRGDDNFDGKGAYCVHAKQHVPKRFTEDCQLGGPFAFTLLCVLLCLHVWWTYLLLRVAVQSSKNDIHASADDVYEGDSDSDDDRRKPAPKAKTPKKKD